MTSSVVFLVTALVGAVASSLSNLVRYGYIMSRMRLTAATPMIAGWLRLGVFILAVAGAFKLFALQSLFGQSSAAAFTGLAVGILACEFISVVAATKLMPPAWAESK